MKAKILNKGVGTHRLKDCRGRICCLHNPSGHKMKKWPVYIRLDKYTLAERVCKHGIGHPDPDSLHWILENFIDTGYTPQEFKFLLEVHGCDGCCSTKRRTK